MSTNDTNKTGDNNQSSNAIKDPDNWSTGDERMTGAQQSYLKTLSNAAGEPFDENLTKAEAAKKIDELQKNKNTTANQGSVTDSGAANTVKNPDDWKTGDEPMTGAQQSYLKTLAGQAGEEVNDDLTKAEASKKIDELQHKTGRGE